MPKTKGANMANMKERIKEVAIDLFYKKGYFATSLSDVAQTIGIRKASIYHHYPSKESLLLSILQTVLLDLTANLHESIQGIEGIEDKMRAAVRSHILFHIDRQKEVLISNSELRGLSPENYEAVVQIRDSYEREFQTLIVDGMEAGVWAEGDFKVLSFAILNMCTSVAGWFKPAGRLSKVDVAQVYEEFIIGGMKSGAYSAVVKV
jgi:AcrR family transcriptional regulator